MKFYLEEHIKHRIIGVVVLASIAMVFLPAVMKQSNYRFDKKMQVAVKLPDKPAVPKVEEPNVKAMFKEIKTAKVNIPKVKEDIQLKEVRATTLAHATTNNQNLNNHPRVARSEIPAIISKNVSNTAASKSMKKSSSGQNAKASKKDIYNVQLASFKLEKNAKILVRKLRGQGYLATYGKYTGKNGTVYAVMVPKLEREDAELVRNQLAVSMRLDGLIIKTG